MNPSEFKGHELVDSDLEFEYEYHQDYREGIGSPFNSARAIVPLIFCLLPLIYRLLQYLDYDLLPLSELIWNCVVYITPVRLLDAVDTYLNPSQISNQTSPGLPRTHAAKSEAMRRILGLDTPGGLIGSVTQAGRRLSTLPGLKLAAQADDGRPAGLGNWDNSCYQNSVLQGLASLDSFSEYLTYPKVDAEKAEGIEKPDMHMAEALKDLIATLNDPGNNGRRIWTPATLKNMNSWQQQDAQEYFSKVLDEIEKEVGKFAKSIQSSTDSESNEASTILDRPQAPQVATNRSPLEGLLAQRVGCTRCGYSEGLSMIPFNCLTVPLGRAWEQSISECLDDYTKLEHIESVECGKCTLLKTQRLLSLVVERTTDCPNDTRAHEASKVRLDIVNEALENDDYEDKTLLQKCNIPSKSRVTSTKSRQAVIARPPKSLVVHFNRSLFDEMTGDLRKNYAEVRFPRVLDLGPWCLGSSENSQAADTEEWHLNPDEPMIASSKQKSRIQGPKYEIRGVVTHYGRHENGHYVCYKKHPAPDGSGQKQQWWRLSDEDVTKVSEEMVLGQGGVFMLFYDCIEAASPALHESTERTLVTSTEALELASQIPLPEYDDDELSESEYQDSLLTTREASIATSVSEFDEDITEEEHEEPEYQPAKAIMVPPYIQQNDVHNKNKGASNRKLASAGSLVMV